MKKKGSREKGSSVFLGVAFIGFIVLLIAVSFMVKFVQLAEKSVYRAEHRFTIAVQGYTDQKEKKEATLISFDPGKKEAIILSIAGLSSLDTVGKELKAPIDGTIKLQKPYSTSQLSSFFLHLILQFQSINTNMTILDLFRLYFDLRSFPETSYVKKKLVLPEDDLVVDKVILSVVSDQKIQDENITIAIRNATEVAGIGSRLARLISNMGGTVVSVSTAEKTQDNSSIASGVENSFTVKRLQSFLQFRTEKYQPYAMSDVIITIGKDSLKKNLF